MDGDGGTFVTQSRVGYGAAGFVRIGTFDVSEGVLRHEGEAATASGDNHFNVQKVIVRSGAEMQGAGAAFSTQAATGFEIETGGQLLLGGTDTQLKIDGFSGAGDVGLLPPYESSGLTLLLKNDDYRFAGRYLLGSLKIDADHTHSLVLERSEALYNQGGTEVSVQGGGLEFASGIEMFRIGGLVSFLLCDLFHGDENGNPLALGVNSLDYKNQPYVSNVSITASHKSGSEWMNAQESMFHKRLRTVGTHLCAMDGSAVLSLSNASWRLGRQYCRPTLGSLSVVDATVETLTPIASKVATGTYEIYADNATFRVNPVENMYNWVFPGEFNQDTKACTSDWTFRIGPRGARFETVQDCSWGNMSHSMYINAAFKPAAGAVCDGGAVFSLANSTILFRPVDLAGPVTLRNSLVSAFSTAHGEGNVLFGTGDLHLDNMFFQLRQDAHVASGVGSGLRVDSAASISFSEITAVPPATLTVGNVSAEADSALTVGPAGTLFLVDRQKKNAFDSSCGKMVVNGGVPCFASGRTKLPVFSAVNGATENYTFGFLSYDGANGFTGFSGSVTDLDHGADSVVEADANSGTTLEVPANETREIAALRTIGWSGANWNNPRASVKINAGATLKVGSDTVPAQILMNNRGTYGRSVIDGTGTLTFGAAGAVFACGSAGATSTQGYVPIIRPTIAGTGPVVFAGVFNLATCAVVLEGANTYSGGTYVTDAQVRLMNSAALGTGPVTVLGGNAGGGQLCFAKAGLVVDNPLTISGYGAYCNGKYLEDFTNGALWFPYDATVSGPVTVVGKARLGARKHQSVAEGGASGTGTFTGVISGGAIQLLKNDKPIVFTGANTYTGETEVISSTLVLKGPCSTGTGPVILDDGVLRFENESAVTFANRIEGLGTVELAGTAPITFGSATELDEDLKLDLCGTAQTLGAMPPFAEIVNSSSQKAKFSLAENLGTVAWGDRTLSPANKIELEIGAGTTLDLGGQTLTVRRLADGSRDRIVNGEIVETNPKLGMMLIVK